MLGILQRGRDPVDPALEPPDPQPRVPVEDAGEEVLAEHLAERGDVDHHAHQHAVVLAGRFQPGLADVVGDGTPDSSIASQTPFIAVLP